MITVNIYFHGALIFFMVVWLSFAAVKAIISTITPL